MIFVRPSKRVFPVQRQVAWYYEFTTIAVLSAGESPTDEGWNSGERLDFKESGGEGGIRTPGTGFSQYNGLANRRIQPLCHLSGVCFQYISTVLCFGW